MMSRIGRLGLGIAGLIAAAAVQAQDGAAADYKKVRLDEVAALVPKIQELVAWATSEHLFRERDRLNAIIVTLDGENSAARAALQYKRKPDGSWSRPPEWKEARNDSEKALGECTTRRAAIVDPVAGRLLDALDRDKATMAPATRKIWLDELIAIAPDNARLRELLGERRLGDRWVLAETAAAAERRPEVAKFAAALRDEKRTIQGGTPTEFEAALKLKWIAVRHSPHMRVVSMLPLPEADKALVQCDTAWRLVHKVLGAEPDDSRPVSVLLFKSADDLFVYFAAHPETPEALRNAPVASFTLGISGNIMAGNDTEAGRLHSARSRASALAPEFGLNSGLLPGWLHEGMAVYVGQLMTGEFLPYFGDWNPAGASAEFVKRARAPKGNWLEAAAALAKDGRGPPLSRLMTLDHFHMNSVDSLMLAAFVAYLIEGRPAEAPVFIRALARNPAAAGAVRETLGLEVDELEKRFRRWLEETTAPKTPKR